MTDEKPKGNRCDRKMKKDKDFEEELKKWTGCFPERILEVEKL